MTSSTRIGSISRALLSASFFSLVIVLPQHGQAAPVTGTNSLGTAADLLRGNHYQEALQSAVTAPADGRRNLLAGKLALKLKQYDEAVSYLSAAERSYPLLADVATALKAEALYGGQHYRDAAAAAIDAAARTPNQALKRRMEKLAADALFEAGDTKGALTVYRQFSSRYSLGKDSIHALYRTGRCQEALGLLPAAVQAYRTVYLQHPAADEADDSLNRLKTLEATEQPAAARFSSDELLRRGLLLLALNHPKAASTAFAAIPRTELSEEQLALLDLKTAQAAIKQRHYTAAEPLLQRAAMSRTVTTRDEARLMLSRLEDRQEMPDKALARLLSLSSERGPLADDALLEAALIHKRAARFTEAFLLLQRLQRDFPASELVSRATWELAWGQYLAADLSAAQQNLQLLFKDASYRERAVYWHARTLERQNKLPEAISSYTLLLREFPFGFYAAWYRTRANLPSGWPALPTNGAPEPPLPDGSQRVQALAALGMQEEARAELSSFKSKGPDAATAPGYARLQALADDRHGAIMTFHQHRPVTMDNTNLSFWAIGYPRPYANLFSQHVAANKLSDALVLALAKAESSFRPQVKSHAGAIGLMQLMPATARMTAGSGGKNFSSLKLIDPEFNIRIGTRHLRDLLDRYNQDTVYTLAAYNAGAGAVNRWRTAYGELARDEFIENIPYQETRDYVKKIIASMAVYQALYLIR